LLKDGDTLSLGDETLKIISTPGHSKGSICILCGDKLISGDTLFANGFGRYDLHGGNANELSESLASLKTLDPELRIYPGHGDTAKLGRALENLLYY
jgi:glyoxylase-like metal-dependent hydrolase (beta-lactamase superfamily II)